MSLSMIDTVGFEKLKLQTGRLVLTPVLEKSTSNLVIIFRDAKVRKFLFDDEVLTYEEITKFITDSLQSFNKHYYGLWEVTEKTSS